MTDAHQLIGQTTKLISAALRAYAAGDADRFNRTVRLMAERCRAMMITLCDENADAIEATGVDLQQFRQALSLIAGAIKAHEGGDHDRAARETLLAIERFRDTLGRVVEHIYREEY